MHTNAKNTKYDMILHQLSADLRKIKLMFYKNEEFINRSINTNI